MPRSNKTRAQNYSVWVDGSSYDGGHRLGAGWVVRQGGRYLRGVAMPITLKGAGNPTIAEIEAVSAALLSLPRKSRVVVHTDCQAVLYHLEAGRTEYQNPSTTSRRRQKLYHSLTGLFDAVARHWQVQIIKVTQEDSRLKEAHNFARIGADMSAPSRAGAIPAPL